MATLLGAMRDIMMTPSLREVSFEGRGFDVAPTPQTAALEAIPQSVVCGFEWGIGARDLWEVERRVSLVEPALRGFAWEGVTMAFTIRDVMPGGRSDRARELLMGPGQPHIFLTYIGIGFAMSKLPRPLWKKVLPDLSGTPYYPTMSWLAVDGYGFDKAYFDTHRWVGRQKRDTPYPWDGWPSYFERAFDQGVGRALWFIHGGNAPAVVAAVNAFASDRRADLWSGVGLAATFAGGCDTTGLALLRRESGPCAGDLAQGAIFAAKARVFSGSEPSHSELAIGALADLTLAKAAILADDVAVGGLESDRVPKYEVWRTKIRESVPVLR